MWQAKLIMQNGELIPFADARVHPLSLGFAYATTVFEGIRAYYNRESRQFSLFRLDEHLARLTTGMKVMRFDHVYEPGYLRDCLIKLIKANEPDDDVYVRLLVYIEAIGMMATTGPVGFTAAAMPREKSKFAETGMSLGVSSWSRIADNASPPRVKCTANYQNGRLAQLQSKADGYEGAIMLTRDGKVSETPIACFFMVRDGRLVTPGKSSDILESITRDTILKLYQESEGKVAEEREIDRTELYFADEAFICGTGQEILPVTTIDKMPVGTGKVGALTSRLQQRYFDVVRGNVPDHPEWRTLVG